MFFDPFVLCLTAWESVLQWAFCKCLLYFADQRSVRAERFVVVVLCFVVDDIVVSAVLCFAVDCTVAVGLCGFVVDQIVLFVMPCFVAGYIADVIRMLQQSCLCWDF